MYREYVLRKLRYCLDFSVSAQYNTNKYRTVRNTSERWVL